MINPFDSSKKEYKKVKPPKSLTIRHFHVNSYTIFWSDHLALKMKLKIFQNVLNFIKQILHYYDLLILQCSNITMAHGTKHLRHKQNKFSSLR